MQNIKSQKLFIEAQHHIPGGVNSPVRSFKSVGGSTPIFIKKAKQSYLYDVDGNRYIDFVSSWGPMILGHAHAKVIKALQKVIKKSNSFGTPTILETKIAKLIKKMAPNIDKIRMVNSGTEACMSAIRLARGFTGKDKIIKFEGCYHGHADSFLIKAGSGVSTTGSLGVTKNTAKNTLIATYNDIDSVYQLVEKNKNEIAAIIIEPVAGNMGCIPPKKNFLQDLRNLCTNEKILLIFDEVMTGFRLDQGGAQAYFNVFADIIIYGKIIGGGLPVGAYAGKNEIMKHISPVGNIYQAGTLSGNPIALTAGYVTLKELSDNSLIYKELEQKTKYLANNIHEILEKATIPHQINHIGSMFSLFFAREKVVDFTSAAKGNNEIFKKFFHAMLQNGIYLPPSPFESWFLSNTLTYKMLNKIIEAVAKTIKSMN